MRIIRTEEYENAATGRTVQVRVGRCHCGAEVELSGFTNTCSCGADYNLGGDLLADRDQWGEETGETAADILGPVTPEEQEDFIRYEAERQQP